MFIKQIWYVAGWSDEVQPDKPFGTIIAGEPVVLWRDSQGVVQALQNRCPHRHAPLSKGRIVGDELQCMYHGLKFSPTGKCVHIPASDVMPPNSDARAYPVVEKDNWIWVWPGDPEQADPDLIPKAWGLEVEGCVFKTGAIDYEADYQLVNDNLTDLSHVDFVHETTLHAVAGVSSSADMPKISKLENGLRFERWFPPITGGPAAGLEMFNCVDYLLPGIFLMKMELFPPGTAEALGGGRPTEGMEPLIMRCEQQAVTPKIEGKCRYVFATGAPKTPDDVEGGLTDTEQFFAVAMAAFAEDKVMIEAQQELWDTEATKAFIPQDKGPFMFRKMIEKRIEEEQATTAS